MLFATLAHPYIFLVCLYFGTVLANIYDTFYFIRKITADNKIVTVIVDIFTVAVGLIVIIGGFYLANDMKIEWFMILGVVLGIILYAISLRKLLHFVIELVYNKLILKIGHTFRTAKARLMGKNSERTR